MVTNAINFFKKDLWRIRQSELTGRKSILIKYLRILVLSLRGFIEDKCHLRASALTFFSLLSIVPVFAMLFGIAKGFGFEKMLESQIMEKAQGQEEIFGYVINFANSMLENTRGGLIAGVGIALLFWSVMKVLGNIEISFNSIWGIQKPRTLGRKLTDYLALMLICPILLVLSSSVTVFVASQVQMMTERVSILGAAAPVIIPSLKILSMGVMWTLFTFIYIFMPNTKVRFSSGLIGGIVAGSLYQLVQWGYLTFQIGASKFGAIYGSFAALPLFLVWLQMSWLVVLFGAEIAFANQNVETYEFESDCNSVSHSFKNLLSLRMTHLCVKLFVKGEKPWTGRQIAHELAMPIRLVRQLLFDLTQAGVLSEVKLNEGVTDNAYQPARDVDTMTVKSVVQALDDRGTNNVPVAASKELEKFDDCLKQMTQSLENAPANILIKNI